MTEERVIGGVAILILLTAAFMLAQACIHAWGGGLYPPIPVIAEQLNIVTGQQLPKGVIWNGRPYFFHIESAKQLPNGRYTVTLQAQ